MINSILQIAKILPAIVLLFKAFKISFLSFKKASSDAMPFLKPN
jgi:hypothetical protein